MEPIFVPSVTVVVAIPEASETVDDGEKLTPPPPLAKKFTVLPATPLPFASETFTENAPSDVLTVPEAVGDAVTATLLAGPILGPDASEPQAATRRATTSSRETNGSASLCPYDDELKV
jgi:hypothetical protein